MRRGVVLLAAALAGCGTVSATEPALPVHGETPVYTCRDEGLNAYAGRQATAQLGAEIRARSGARVLRWVPHGGAITMDFRTDRVNVRLDPQNRIESVRCG